jgi:multidrug efflux pump
MQMAGFTINLLTLLAIVLCVGIVVDDAIVMVENIERHLSEGLSATEAAIKGARELIGPIISMTITLAVVYAPIGLQGGLTGSLFREFAFTLAGAVMVSGVVSGVVTSSSPCRRSGGWNPESGLASRFSTSVGLVMVRFELRLSATCSANLRSALAKSPSRNKIEFKSCCISIR